jgi:hypothetical protein
MAPHLAALVDDLVRPPETGPRVRDFERHSAGASAGFKIPPIVSIDSSRPGVLRGRLSISTAPFGANLPTPVTAKEPLS